MEHRFDKTGVFVYYPDGGRQVIAYYDISQANELVWKMRVQVEKLKKDPLLEVIEL